MSPLDECCTSCPTCWRTVCRDLEDLCACMDPICESCCDEGRHHDEGSAA